VYLGIAEPSVGGALLARREESRADRRFVQNVCSVVDDNTGASPQEIEWAEPQLRLFFGDESRQGYQVMRIAQLVRGASGALIVRDNYVPPVLHLSAAPFIRSGLQRVLTAAVARQRDLVVERAQLQGGNGDFHAAAARRFWLLHTLSGAIPQLAHLLDTPRSHPEETYLALATLVGQLSSFSDAADVRQIPKFDYQELGDGFEALFARALSLLSEGVESPYVEIELQRRAEDGMYLGSFAAADLLDQELFVAIRSSQAEAVVRDRAPGVVKIASWNEIYQVVKQARRGVRLAVEWNPASVLPVRPGVCFFRIQKEGPYWEDVARSSSLALALPEEGEWQGSSVAIYAVGSRYVR
jgi:type VI secretion system protein ImpJ